MSTTKMYSWETDDEEYSQNRVVDNLSNYLGVSYNRLVLVGAVLILFALILPRFSLYWRNLFEGHQNLFCSVGPYSFRRGEQVSARIRE